VRSLPGWKVKRSKLKANVRARWKSSVCTPRRTDRAGKKRWFVFKPKIPILGKLGEFWRVIAMEYLGMFLTILLFYCYWKYFMAIWYILWSFGIFFPILVFCTKKNLATQVIEERQIQFLFSQRFSAI
jgi:hypothetical protein